MEIVLLNKVESIERCVNRIEEIESRDDFSLENYDYQDIIILNLQRACQQAIDLAMYVVSARSLGLPKSSRDAFAILKEKKIISDCISDKMCKMVGFRNIIIHEYQKVEPLVITYILENGLDDFKTFTKEVIRSNR